MFKNTYLFIMYVFVMSLDTKCDKLSVWFLNASQFFHDRTRPYKMYSFYSLYYKSVGVFCNKLLEKLIRNI